MNCPILRLHVVRWGFMLFFFPTEGLSIMQLYCCIWVVGLLSIYLSCVFPLSRGQELPAEVMHSQSWSGKMLHFISCQAVEALISIKNNSLQKWQVVIKVCYRKHSLSGKYRNQWKINPGPFLHLQSSRRGIPAWSLPALTPKPCSLLGAVGIFLQPCQDPFSQSEVHLAA